MPGGHEGEDQGGRGRRRGARRARSAAVSDTRAMFELHAESERRGIPVDELAGARGAARADGGEERGLTRRALLLGGAALAGGVALGARADRSLASEASEVSRAGRPRIAIVGGGLAGLRCAHLLWTRDPHRPIAATVFDANPERAGGRCWTLRGFFGGGLITEHGGAFLNSPQLSIRRLAAQLGLAEEAVNGGDLPSGREVYWIGGARYTYAEANTDWGSVGFPAFRRALREARTPAGERRLDSMSVPQWLDSTEIGSASRFGKLMLANAVTENGGDPEDMSAFDLIETTGRNPRSELSPIPGDDEKYHIVGGNDQIVSRMIAQLPPAALRQGHELVALRANADRSMTLSFDAQGRSLDVRADFVVLALPFSTLRDVDLSASGLSASKQTVIQTLGMGTNAKIHVELARKTWPALGYSGATYSEWEGFCCAWDDSVALGPDAAPALFLGFPGAHVGDSGLSGAAHGPAPTADVQRFLGEIELLYPGTIAAYTGRAYEDHWARDPWVRGAYSYFRVGQASSYGPIAAATEGRVHFAGEHTSPENQGFLDGAVATGERAARQLLSRI
jgi:monoamine oxidase